jgi:putative transposase
MARPLRIQYEGAVYHVTSRGNERKAIFRSDEDREEFLRLLSISLKIYKVLLHSYVLMENHFHLLVETPLANLGEFMRHFNISYTGFYNRRYKRAGHLFQGRYKSILVDKGEYLSVVSRYIHLNPIRVKSFRSKSAEEKYNYLGEYRWSSLAGYIHNRKDKMVSYALVLSEYGGETRQGRSQYRKRILKDIGEGLEIRKDSVGQSILGNDDFISWVKEKFIKGDRDRESPDHRQLGRYRAEEKIVQALEKASGESFASIKKKKHPLRSIAMDLLYRIGGLKGIEIGKIFKVDYSTVSQSRKRLRETLESDEKLGSTMARIEQELLQVKN